MNTADDELTTARHALQLRTAAAADDGAPRLARSSTNAVALPGAALTSVGACRRHGCSRRTPRGAVSLTVMRSRRRVQTSMEPQAVERHAEQLGDLYTLNEGDL
jgi:hypothetical protein